MKLKNVNALITGGSQGLGKVIAEHFLREGANLVICARGEKELLATRGELAGEFPARKVFAKTCDVSNEKQVNELAEFALRELGSLQALVLNAGIYGPMGPPSPFRSTNGGAHWTSICSACCCRAARSFRILSMISVAAEVTRLKLKSEIQWSLLTSAATKRLLF